MPRPRINQEEKCVVCGKSFLTKDPLYILTDGLACSKECFDSYIKSIKKFNEDRKFFGK